MSTVQVMPLRPPKRSENAMPTEAAERRALGVEVLW